MSSDIISKLKCKWSGHQYKRTELFDRVIIHRNENGVICQRCGKVKTDSEMNVCNIGLTKKQ